MLNLASKTIRGTACGKRASRIIIAHGLLGNGSNWLTVAQHLVQHHALRERVHEVDLLDMRNHGDSPHVPNHTNAAMASDLELFALRRQTAVSSKTDADEGAVLVGHSMGGLAVMAALLRRANESALLLPEPSDLDARCDRGEYFGWRDAQGYGQAMRAVHAEMGFAPNESIADVLLALPPNASSGGVHAPRQRTGPRVKAAIIVDMSPAARLGALTETSQSVVSTLEAMAAADLAQVRSFGDGAKELERVGMASKEMRDFVLTNLRFDSATGQAKWRCNLPALIGNYRDMELGLRAWYMHAHRQSSLETSPATKMVSPARSALPVLFVYGGDSPYNRAEDRSMNSIFFSNLKEAVIPGAGHFVHYEKMTDFIAVVAPFLAEYL